MVKKLVLGLLFLIILSSSLVLAIPKTQLTTLSTTSNFLEVVYPKQEFFPLNTNFSLEFHVFNSSGALLTTGVNCSIHIYNYTNDHILLKNLTLDSNNKDFYVNITENLFSKIGRYSYIVYCVNSGEYGFVSNPFYVSEDGRDTSKNYLAFILVLAVCIFAWAMLNISHNLDDEHILLKLLLYFISFISLVGAVTMSFSIISSSGLSQTIFNNANTIYKLVLWGFRLFVAYIVLYYAYVGLKFLNEVIKTKNE